MSPIDFNAPWGRLLRIKSVVATAILLIASVVFAELPLPLAVRAGLAAVPLILMVIALLFAIRGYTLTENELIVRRVGRNKNVPLADLLAVDGKADALRGAIRIIGNGGLYSFSGVFWNRQLRLFRAYATDRSRAVILRFPGKTIVITPHDPQQFIMRARTYLKTREFPR